MGITVDINKAKSIAHERRRAARAQELAPLDIKVTIPGEQQSAEAARQEIRERYAAMQKAIDDALTLEEIKAATASLK